MDVNYTCGGHFAIYIDIESCCISETNIMLYAYISKSIALKKKKKTLKLLNLYSRG